MMGLISSLKLVNFIIFFSFFVCIFGALRLKSLLVPRLSLRILGVGLGCDANFFRLIGLIWGWYFEGYLWDSVSRFHGKRGLLWPICF